MCLHKSVNVTDNNKNAYWKFCQFYVHFNSIMFTVQDPSVSSSHQQSACIMPMIWSTSITLFNYEPKGLYYNCVLFFLDDPCPSRKCWCHPNAQDVAWKKCSIRIGFYENMWSYLQPGKSYWRGRLSTIDLLVLSGLDQLLFMLKILFTFFPKLLTLMWRSTVLILPPQSVFLASAHIRHL